MKKDVALACDDDFFTLFECPYCNRKFKISNGFCMDEEFLKIYCPYCGMYDEINGFIDEENYNELKDELHNMVIDYINKNLIKSLKNSYKGSKGIKIKANNLKHKTIRKAIQANDMYEIKSKCCSVKVKLDGVKHECYCVKCGGYSD